MKKLSLFFGFALMASMVFAQTATITQTGTSNASSILQKSTGNTAVTDQNGTSNMITVEQKNGSGNLATVNQNGTKNGEGSVPINMGFVKQDGANNEALINEGVRGGAVSNFADAYIDQKGVGNFAKLSTEGSYFNSIFHGITQIQDLQGLGNRATVSQKNYNSDMSVYQKGADNEFTGIQDGSNNQYAVKQIGLTNKAGITQLGNNNIGGSWDNGSSDYTPEWNLLLQTGDENLASALQKGGSKFKMTQKGNLNVARIEEQANNVVTTLQEGNRNIIGGILNCVPTDVAIFADGASMFATQLGDNNKLYVSTAGSLTVNQDNHLAATMDGNTIKYTQTAAGTVDFTQLGDKNLIWLKNTSVYVPMDVDVDQIGTSNTVALFGGETLTCAKFAGAHLNVDQVGDLNALHLDSQFTGAVVDVMQTGTSNWASVIQK